jgi:cardiolipin synthase
MSLFTAANQLTLLRLLLVPVFALCIMYGRPGWALVTFGVASATDLLDGLIARRTGPTTLGAWLDPIADKLLVVTMFILLTIPAFAPVAAFPVWLTVLVFSRDLAIIVTVAVVNLAIARRTFKPSLLGKTATAFFAITGVVALYVNYSGSLVGLFQVGVWISGALTIASGVEYILRLRTREQ